MMIAKKTDPAVTIRFPKQVLAQVKQVAKANSRSLNSEVISRLASSLELAASQPK